MSSMYKFYTMILVERLREEVEGKGVILQTQTGFRKRMGTIDNIYILNYVVNKQIGRVAGGPLRGLRREGPPPTLGCGS